MRRQRDSNLQNGVQTGGRAPQDVLNRTVSTAEQERGYNMARSDASAVAGKSDKKDVTFKELGISTHSTCGAADLDNLNGQIATKYIQLAHILRDCTSQIPICPLQQVPCRTLHYFSYFK